MIWFAKLTKAITHKYKYKYKEKEIESSSDHNDGDKSTEKDSKLKKIWI